MIFPNFILFPRLSVGRNVMLAPSLVTKKRRDATEAQARRLFLADEGMPLILKRFLSAPH